MYVFNIHRPQQGERVGGEVLLANMWIVILFDLRIRLQLSTLCTSLLSSHLDTLGIFIFFLFATLSVQRRLQISLFHKSSSVCVCVQHLNRCKTSNLLTPSINAGGLRLLNRTQANEDTCWEVWNHSGTPEWRTCYLFSFFHWSGMGLSQEPLYRSFRNHRLCYFPLQGLHTAWFPQSGCIDLFHLFVLGLWSDLCRDVRIRLGYGNCTVYGDLMIAPTTRLAWSIYGYLCDSDPVRHVYFPSWWSTILHPWDYLGSENRVWLYWIFFMFIVYHFEEIYFRSLFLIQLHVRGFSSQRITSMIHFLSSVCVCFFVCVFLCFTVQPLPATVAPSPDGMVPPILLKSLDWVDVVFVG